MAEATTATQTTPAVAAPISVILDNGKDSVQVVLSNLNFIALFKNGEKLNPDTQAPVGWFGSDTRQKTLEFVRVAIDAGFNGFEACGKEKSDLAQKMRDQIRDALIAARAGIETLTVTYSDDRKYVSQVRALLGIYDAKIAPHLPPKPTPVEPEKKN